MTKIVPLNLTASQSKMVFNGGSSIRIEDIRQNEIGPSVLDDLRQGLRPLNGGEKRLPTLLLYDEEGLRLFEDISYLEEYYLTNAEVEILERYATEIAACVPHGCLILELGSGYGSTLEREYPSPFVTAAT